MKTFQLLENIQFHDDHAYAEPLQVDGNSRILRFSLQPGQVVREHKAPNSPVHIVVLQGHGLFAGGDGIEQSYGPNALLYMDPDEAHSIRAGDEPLVFLLILHGAPSTR